VKTLAIPDKAKEALVVQQHGLKVPMWNLPTSLKQKNLP